MNEDKNNTVKLSPGKLVPRIKPKLIIYRDFNFGVIGEGRRGEVINFVNDKLALLQEEYEIHQVMSHSTTYGDDKYVTKAYLTLLVSRR